MGFMNGRRKPNLAAQSVGTLIGEVRMDYVLLVNSQTKKPASDYLGIWLRAFIYS